MDSTLSDDERALVEAYRAVESATRAAMLILATACAEAAKERAALATGGA